jgi:hypothetical protein
MAEVADIFVVEEVKLAGTTCEGITSSRCASLTCIGIVEDVAQCVRISIRRHNSHSLLYGIGVAILS